MRELYYNEWEAYNKECSLKSGEAISYISTKQFQKIYPKGAGGYTVVGSIGVTGKGETGLCKVGEEAIPYYAYLKSGLWRQTEGYIKVGEGEYLALCKSTVLRNLLLLIILISLIAAVTAIWPKTPKKLAIDDGAGKFKAPISMGEDSDPTHITIPGYDNIRMKADTDTAYVALWNPDENPCYFLFTIVEQDTGKELYKSGLIPPGYAVTEVKLNKKITKGTHPVTIRVSSFALDDSEAEMNGGEVNTNLVGVASQEEQQ